MQYCLKSTFKVVWHIQQHYYFFVSKIQHQRKNGFFRVPDDEVYCYSIKIPVPAVFDVLYISKIIDPNKLRLPTKNVLFVIVSI